MCFYTNAEKVNEEMGKLEPLLLSEYLLKHVKHLEESIIGTSVSGHKG